MIAVQPLAAQVGVAPACQALGVSRATFYRRQRSTPGHQQPRPTPARALCEAEREQILDVLAGPRFVDRAPAEVVATLLDEGHYLCSERTMSRILAADQPVRERRNQREHPQYTKPELERVRHRQNQKGDSQGSQKVIQAMSWVKGGQPWMTRPYSEDLRERVVRVVESGTSRNAAAKQFDVSISFVVKLMQRWKQRGTIKADKYGGWKKSKLAPHGDRIRALVMENCDITIDELCVLLAAEGIEAKRSTLGDFLLAQGLSRKKRQPTPPSRSALTSRRREPLGATSNLG